MARPSLRDRHRGGGPQHRLCRRLPSRFLCRADQAFAGEFALPVLGRVSMDLVAVGCDAAPGLKEGDWVEIDYDLPSASTQSGLSQYELLTTLGSALRAALGLIALLRAKPVLGL